MKIAMLCLRGAPPTEESEILDIKKILEDFVWNNFKSSQGVCAKTFLRRRDFIVDVPLNFYHTEDVNQKLTPRQHKKEPSRSGYDHRHGDHTSDLRTEFRNNTGTNQTYKFRFERTRKASVTVTFQKGFTFGGKAHFSLGLPVAGGRASGDVNMTLQVTKTDAENFEDTLVLETTSDIAVEKKHSYITGVILKHRDVSYDFTLDTIITMPLNKAPVAIRKRKGGEVLSSFYIENLKDVFLDFPNVEFIPQRSADGKSQTYSVKIRTSGIVEGVQLSDQQIFLDSKKIESEDKSTSTLDIVPPTLARPTDLGTPITPTTTSKEDTSVKVTTDDTTDAKAVERLKDPQTATERRTSFKRFNQFGENYTSLTATSPETKILQTPKIPTIIKTSPTTPRVSPVPSDSEAAFPKHRLREVTPKRSGRPKSPLLMNSPSSSFQGTSPQTQRPKLSKMTSV